MQEIKDLETILEGVALSLNWRAVMHYEHDRLVGITMGTVSHISETTGIHWEDGNLKLPVPTTGQRLRLIKETET